MVSVTHVNAVHGAEADGAPKAPDDGDDDDDDLQLWLLERYTAATRDVDSVPEVVEALRKSGVETVSHLMNATKETLDITFHAIPAHGQFIMEQRDLHSTAVPTAIGDKLQQKACLHKVRRYFMYHADDGSLARMPKIDHTCVDEALKELALTYKSNAVVEQLRAAFLKSFYTYQAFARGLLLYGPPGTGKTVLIDCISAKCGLHLIEPMITAGELNRSYVGESEQLIKDIFLRATVSPHLPCIVAIDEIDAAVPMRDASGGGNQHGADKVSAFLGLIGGGSDIPNLVLIGASNRREAIDRAIRRRLQIQIYVGYPDKESRGDIIKSVLRSKSDLTSPKRGMDKTKFFTDDFIDKVKERTMNFSGAALKALCSALASEWSDYYVHGTDSFTYGGISVKYTFDGKSLGQEKALEYHLRHITESFDLKLGTLFICELLRQKNQITTDRIRNVMYGKGSTTLNRATGLILVDMRNNPVPDAEEFGFEPPEPSLELQMEVYLDKAGNRSETTVEAVNLRPYCPECKGYATASCRKPTAKDQVWIHTLNWKEGGRSYNSSLYNASALKTTTTGVVWQQKTAKEEENLISEHVPITMDHVLREGVRFAQERGLTRIALLNMSTFVLVGGASSEQSFIHELATELKQAMATGSRTLLVIDMDSLASVSRSQSETGTSTSIGNRQLFDVATENFLKLRALVHESADRLPRTMPTEPDTSVSECWCMCVIRDNTLMEEFRQRTGWPESPIEKAVAEKKRFLLGSHKCDHPDCQLPFEGSRNRDLPGDCRYHPGELLHVRANGTSTVYNPRPGVAVIDVASRDALRKQMSAAKAPSAGGDDYVYTCCRRGIFDDGCRSRLHKVKDEKCSCPRCE